MANRLKMTVAQSILSLHAQRWSQHRIADTLEIDRGTVARHIRRAALAAQPDPAGISNAANAPIDPARVAAADSKAAIAPTGSATAAQPVSTTPAAIGVGSAGRQSDAEPWRESILAGHAQGLSAKRIHQDLVAELGASGISYDSVRRLLKRLGAVRPLPMRRMECEPGQEAQVDFGTGARIKTPEGKRRKTHVLRVVLSHSRKAYSEACFRQTAEDFLRVLENAFWHFGGVPKTVVVDNLKAAVLRPDWFDPDLNPKLQSFAQHYGTVILPTKPRMPRHKGKVERGVGYVQDNGLKAREFASLEAENQHLAHWEQNIADTRIHGTTKRHVGKVFREVEQAALLPLPAERFPFFHEAQRIVSRDGHIEVAKAYYSAPPEYLGRTVWARWDERLVRVFNHRFEQIALHVRRAPGKFSTLSEHIAPEKISGVERGAAWLLRKIEVLGEHAHAWAQTMLKTRGIEGVRVLQGLLSLSARHPCEAIDEACETALSYGAFRLQTLRQLLKRRGPAQQPLPFLDEHPIIRPLSDYGGWLRDALSGSRGWNQQAPQVPPPDPQPPSPLL
jgi:transposase